MSEKEQWDYGCLATSKYERDLPFKLVGELAGPGWRVEATDEENSRHSVVVVGVDDDERVRKSQVAPTPTSSLCLALFAKYPKLVICITPRSIQSTLQAKHIIWLKHVSVRRKNRRSFLKTNVYSCRVDTSLYNATWMTWMSGEDSTISQPQEQFPAVRYPNLCVTYVSN